MYRTIITVAIFCYDFHFCLSIHNFQICRLLFDISLSEVHKEPGWVFNFPPTYITISKNLTLCFVTVIILSLGIVQIMHGKEALTR